MGLISPLSGSLHRLERGRLNLITDVPGVGVGHCTVNVGYLKTGVTAIIPQPDSVFLNKLPAAVHVINGFGKSLGLVQVEELGNIETPILLTNTLSVGTCFSALARRAMAENPEIGDTTGTVNPVVMECNDGFINDIRAMGITEAHAFEALDSAASNINGGFDEGAFGAGTGMICYGLKGGIGSASRVIPIEGTMYTLGCLVLTNFGSLRDLTIDGDAAGQRIYEKLRQDNGCQAPEAVKPGNFFNKQERGSIIVVLATDAPLSDRQLKRICRRVQSGIAHTGSYVSNGSGEIALAFSTANRQPHFNSKQTSQITVLSENAIDLFFIATVSVVEESIISSLVNAKSVVSRKGAKVFSLTEVSDAVSD